MDQDLKKALAGILSFQSATRELLIGHVAGSDATYEKRLRAWADALQHNEYVRFLKAIEALPTGHDLIGGGSDAPRSAMPLRTSKGGGPNS